MSAAHRPRAVSLRADRAPPRILSLRVENYRALRSVEIKDLAAITILLGPNGSGKSTVFDVFNFLSECFQYGLRHAWDRRGRARELRTRGQEGPIVIELKYREAPDRPIITYHLAIDERRGSPVVAEEWLRWTRGARGRPFKFVDYREGTGSVISGQEPDISATLDPVPLRSPDLIAVNTLGQLAEHPRIAALREFITDWHVSYLSIDDTRGQPEAGPQARLSKSGDNLPNVIQFLRESHPDELDHIFRLLGQRIPRLEWVQSDTMPDGRLLLQIKDAPFERPILARFASDGTLKMLAYLVLLHDPAPPRFIGIEEPENFLHPRLLTALGEECRTAGARTQLLVTSHSPYFLDAMRPQDVRVLYRDAQGFTQVVRASDIPGIKEFVDAGALLGQLWAEGRFAVGDPFVASGEPAGAARP